MKVMLVVPTFNYQNQYPSFLSVSDFPTGLAYIAASLKQAGHQVIGLNLNNITGYATPKDMITDRITKALKEYKPDLIATGGLCTDYFFLRDAIKVIRRVSNTPVVLGGGIVTHDAEFIFNHLKPEYAVIGEGEQAIVDIASGQVEKGIIKAQVIQDLDSLPVPDYEPFGIKDMMDNFSMSTRLLYRYSRPYPRVFGIVTARGCPFSCTFCIHGHRESGYRARTIPSIMAEIKETYEKYHYNVLLILDELFAVNKERMREFCDALLAGKEQYGWDFDWTFQTHASARLDLATLKLAKKAGCYLFSYGLESASPAVLQSMNKKVKPEQFVEAIKLAKEAEIGFSGNLIFGDPAETDETIAESLNFWLNYCRTEFVFLSYIQLYPGSKLFDDANVVDKVRYYENVGKSVNLTKMTDSEYLVRMAVMMQLEKSWGFVKHAKVVSVQVEKTPTIDVLQRYSGGNYYLIKAICPHCGKVSTYRQIFGDIPQNAFIGTGCTHCNRRVRINLEGEKC